jgi:hypothetical protein
MSRSREKILKLPERKKKKIVFLEGLKTFLAAKSQSNSINLR